MCSRNTAATAVSHLHLRQRSTLKLMAFLPRETRYKVPVGDLDFCKMVIRTLIF